MTITISFSDLLPTKQAELLEIYEISDPKEMNWDVFPIAEWELHPEDLLQ